jgi:hypothetical protein
MTAERLGQKAKIMSADSIPAGHYPVKEFAAGPMLAATML